MDGVRVPKAAELVAAQLRREIVTGERAEGELLPPEPALMAEFGVSRPTLRQALRILESELFITVQRGARGGTRVHPPSPKVAGRFLGTLLQHRRATLDDLHAGQLMIEPPAVAELAVVCDADGIRELRELNEACRGAADRLELQRLGSAFHLRLVQLTGNQTLTLFAALTQQLLDAHVERYERSRHVRPSRTGDHLDEHDRVIELIEARDPAGAAEHWRDHLRAIHASLAAEVDTAGVLDLEV